MTDAGGNSSASAWSSTGRRAPVVVPDAGGDSGSLPAADELKQAIKTIRPVEDFKALPTKPCTRESLLYGIGTGAAMGGIRMFSARVPVAANWAVGTFIVVSGASMYICTKAREEEHRTAQAIIKKFPERNIRLAQKRAAEAANKATPPSPSHPSASTTSSSSSSSSSSSIDELPPVLVPNEAASEGELRNAGDTLSRAAPGGPPVGVDAQYDNRQQSQGSTATPSSSWWSWAWGRK